MKGTNRKEMRKLLNKALALMKIAFDRHLNMNVNTRLDEEKDRPWFTGHVSIEGCDFTMDDGRSLHFYVYEHRTVRENEKELERVEEFIEKHGK